MLKQLIHSAIRHRWLVMIVTLGMCALGLYNYRHLPIDAVPDITNVQVQINTHARGYSPLESEQRVTFPVETAMAGLPNLEPPLRFDVHDAAPVLGEVAAIVCINMIHIAPWSACEALLRHAGALLSLDAPLVLYGPFMRDGVHTAPSNAAFDASLRARNAAWGVRDVSDVDGLARLHGFTLQVTIAMPANNLSVVWRRTR